MARARDSVSANQRARVSRAVPHLDADVAKAFGLFVATVRLPVAVLAAPVVRQFQGRLAMHVRALTC